MRYRYTSDGVTPIAIEINGAGGCPGNSVVEAYAVQANGGVPDNTLAVDDDSGVDQCSRLVFQPPAGEIEFVVRFTDAADAIEYEISFNQNP